MTETTRQHSHDLELLSGRIWCGLCKPGNGAPFRLQEYRNPDCIKRSNRKGDADTSGWAAMPHHSGSY
jgi:hypothetical protein